VIVVGGGVAFFLLKGGGDKDTPDPIDTSDLSSPGQFGDEAHKVHFSLRATTTETTVTKSKADKAEVKVAAKDIRDTLDNLYTLAFTDPEHWKSGDYENVFGFFAQGKPADSAKRDVAVLTLGPGAGDTFDDVTPKYSSVVVKVLTDKGGQPFTAAATANFSADGSKKDGSSMRIKSHATYYLQRGEGGWIIVAYKAKRSDGSGNGSGGNGGNGSPAAPTSEATSGAGQ
jgi:hypothetical protein